MNEIICPQCQKAFKIDEAGYADILKQVRDDDFDQQLHKRLELEAEAAWQIPAQMLPFSPVMRHDGRHQAEIYLSHCPVLPGHLSRQNVINSIRDGSNTFFTQVDGRRADLAVVDWPTGPYVRTHADGAWTDNLLALPECA
jgi:hypothetical protein